MEFIFINDNGKIDTLNLQSCALSDETIKDKVFYSASSCKFTQARDFLKAYNSGAKLVLVDSYNKSLLQEVDALKIAPFGEDAKKTLFDMQDFSVMLFTSGSTGAATAVMKKKTHFDREIDALLTLFEGKKYKKIIVTVPFVHIYGLLFGLLLPMRLGVSVIVKQHFLPNDLIELFEDDTLVVTTPLYIKSLLKGSPKQDFSKVTFCSSTAPLGAEVAQSFKQQFGSEVIQFFGSTETGGIAYKEGATKYWRPLDGVKIGQNSDGLLFVDSPFVSDTIYNKNIQKVQKPFQTFDFVQMSDEGFELIGRDSKIFKVAGKRYSTLEMENILESLEGVERVLVEIAYNNESLRGEELIIYLQSKKKYKTIEIKKILQNRLSNIQFMLRLQFVDEIPLSQTGKKLSLKELQC